MGEKSSRHISIDKNLNNLLDDTNASSLINGLLKRHFETEIAGSIDDEERLKEKKMLVEKRIMDEKVSLAVYNKKLEDIQQEKDRQEEMKIKPTEETFFKNAVVVLERDFNFLGGQMKGYTNTFHKEIDKETFLSKMEDFKAKEDKKTKKR